MQSAASNTATAQTLHAGGYPELGDQYWARIPQDARDSALFMLGFHLGGQGLRLTAGKADAARRNASTAPEPLGTGRSLAPDSGIPVKRPVEPPASEAGAPEPQDAHASPNAPQDSPSLEQARAALAEGARASVAVQAHDTLVDIGSQAQRTAMSKNDPASLSRIVQGMAKQSSLREFYADGEALAPVLEKSGLSPEALETILPGVTWAIRTNGCVRIPAETLAVHPFLQDVLPDARIEPGAMSHAEAQALVRQHTENIERQGDETGDDEQDDGASDRQRGTYNGHPLFSDAEWAKYQSELQKIPPRRPGHCSTLCRQAARP